jgi:hypothetical protein
MYEVCVCECECVCMSVSSYTVWSTGTFTLGLNGTQTHGDLRDEAQT